MKIIFDSVTKLFTVVTHYTNGEGAKGIMREGFKNVSNHKEGICTFRNEYDHIRNEPRWNMDSMMDNINKRYNRLKNKNHQSWKLDPESTLHHNMPDVTNRYYKRYNQDADYAETKDGVAYQNDTGEIKVPKGYAQISYLQGIGRGNVSRDDRKPVYRVVSETINDSDIIDHRRNETNVPESNFDNSKNKVEIPRGMYDGIKRVKRGYINDFNDFDESDYNTEDAPTKEAVNDIKKKWQFLNKSHGKKRRIK